MSMVPASSTPTQVSPTWFPVRFLQFKEAAVSLQADNEPICIDSDEDDHAAGSAPARESDQNGAGPELRRSERTNLNRAPL